MRIDGRPLMDTRADAELFVDDQSALARLDTAAERHLNVLVSGARGSGKTSLLRQFLRHRRSTPSGAAALVSVGTASSAAQLLALVQRAITPAEAPLDAEHSPHAEARTAAEVVDALAGAGANAAIILLDNVPPALGHAVFGQLRDELWQLPFSWVVTCAADDELAFLRPPADAFFDSVLRVAPLEAASMRDLLRRRVSDVELDDAGLTSVVELAAGNPRAALDLTRLLVTHATSPSELRANVASRARALGQLGRSAAMLLAELEATGGASASDEALLSRLGWTRARAAQVLEQLANAGLVAPVDVRNGPGRPRRVYRPTTAAAR